MAGARDRSGLPENTGGIVSTREGLVINPANYGRWTRYRLTSTIGIRSELFYVDFDLQLIQMRCMQILLVRQNVLDGRLGHDEGLAQAEKQVHEALDFRKGKKGLHPRLRGSFMRFVQ